MVKFTAICGMIIRAPSAQKWRKSDGNSVSNGLSLFPSNQGDGDAPPSLKGWVERLDRRHEPVKQQRQITIPPRSPKELIWIQQTARISIWSAINSCSGEGPNFEGHSMTLSSTRKVRKWISGYFGWFPRIDFRNSGPGGPKHNWMGHLGGCSAMVGLLVILPPPLNLKLARPCSFLAGSGTHNT